MLEQCLHSYFVNLISIKLSDTNLSPMEVTDVVICQVGIAIAE